MYLTRSRPARGFTLIELLLVLVILSILGGLVALKFASRPEQARTIAARTEIKTLSTALESFKMDTGRFPTSDEGLRALVVAPSNIRNFQGPYTDKETPLDPWGNGYVYRYPGQHNVNGFDLYSCGPDGQDGSNDDVDNWTQK